MVDYNELRKKFKPKGSPKSLRSSRAQIKAIQREYELKKAELSGGAPLLKKGPLFYGFVIVFMIFIGALVVPQILSGGLSFGKKRIERNQLQVGKAIRSLSVALGRYKFHVGEYPTNAEGLEVLAYRRPEELRKIRAAHPTWDGPYVDHIVKDPWGEEYVYETREEGGHPVLYSKGPDRRAGTLDDILPDQLAFEDAFRDPSWTNHWVRAELRGIIVAPDEETRRRVQDEMRQYD